MNWHIFEPFVFRTTGFSFRELASLRLDDTVAALDRLEAWDAEIERRREAWWVAAFAHHLASAEEARPKPKPQVRALCAIRAALKRHEPIQPEQMQAALGAEAAHAERDCSHTWNEALLSRAACLAEAQAIFIDECARLTDSLWQAADDPAFREAVFLSSPDAFAGLVQRPRGTTDNSKQRAAERLVFSYLQRFCAKNDTTSFFGPVTYGRFVPEADASLRFEAVGGLRWTRRKAFFSHWAVLALAQKMSEDDAVFHALRPRKLPLISADSGQRFVHHGSGKRFELPSLLATLLHACDGRRTVQELSLVLGLPLASAVASLRRMVQLRLVDCSLPLASTAVDALDALDAAVQALPPTAAESARGLVDKAQQQRHSFARAPWPERREVFHATEAWLQELGIPARRKGGELYGDRLALYEDCAGTLSGLQIGGALYRRLQASLPPLMEFLAGAAILRRLDAQDALRSQLSAGGSRLFIDLVRVVQAPAHEPAQAGPREQAFNERLRRVLQAAHSAHGILLTAPMLNDALAPWRAVIEREMASFPLLLPSPDVMVAAASTADIDRGEFQLILSELHDDCSTVFAGFFAEFHETPTELREQLERHIRSQPGWQQMATVLGNRRSKHVTPELPGLTIHLSGLSSKCADEVVPVSEICIEDGEHGLSLCARGKRLLLYPGDVRSMVHSAFALPSVVPLDWLSLWGQPQLPRISFDGLVIQRATWQLDTASLPALAAGRIELDGIQRMRAWMARHGVPPCSFARWSPNEKPLLVDVRNPWSIELLHRVARQHPSLRVTEMFPDPSNLFFDAGRGVQTFELRLALSRNGAPVVKAEPDPHQQTGTAVDEPAVMEGWA